jgi:hypothetical protein
MEFLYPSRIVSLIFLNERILIPFGIPFVLQILKFNLLLIRELGFQRWVSIMRLLKTRKTKSVITVKTFNSVNFLARTNLTICLIKKGQRFSKGNITTETEQ